jgi:hypothetical protein
VNELGGEGGSGGGPPERGGSGGRDPVPAVRPGEGPPGAERQRTIDTLCEAFANDELEVEEFERRVETAHRATSSDELRRLLSDLPTGRQPVRAGAGAQVQPRAGGGRIRLHGGEVREWSLSVGIMGGMNRRGHWVPARHNVAVGLMGGCTLDFREAAFPPGVTEVHAVAIWGGIEVIVPPWLPVETSGIGIMGGFEHRQDAPASDDPDAPVLRISGLALMGGVDVMVRMAGESSKDARRRIKEERKSARPRAGRRKRDEEEP